MRWCLRTCLCTCLYTCSCTCLYTPREPHTGRRTAPRRRASQPRSPAVAPRRAARTAYVRPARLGRRARWPRAAPICHNCQSRHQATKRPLQRSPKMRLLAIIGKVHTGAAVVRQFPWHVATQVYTHVYTHAYRHADTHAPVRRHRPAVPPPPAAAPRARPHCSARRPAQHGGARRHRRRRVPKPARRGAGRAAWASTHRGSGLRRISRWRPCHRAGRRRRPRRDRPRRIRIGRGNRGRPGATFADIRRQF